MIPLLSIDSISKAQKYKQNKTNPRRRRYQVRSGSITKLLSRKKYLQKSWERWVYQRNIDRSTDFQNLIKIEFIQMNLHYARAACARLCQTFSWGTKGKDFRIKCGSLTEHRQCRNHPKRMIQVEQYRCKYCEGEV